jgi:hypothetical protein
MQRHDTFFIQLLLLAMLGSALPCGHSVADAAVCQLLLLLLQTYGYIACFLLNTQHARLQVSTTVVVRAPARSAAVPKLALSVHVICCQGDASRLLMRSSTAKTQLKHRSAMHRDALLLKHTVWPLLLTHHAASACLLQAHPEHVPMADLLQRKRSAGAG